ncbi:MAG: AraC family transcriptional regulator [Ruminococcaceae bacterium]|nr:AraC family transcriptional regulator [Oscillospiraceae bacterium]
MKEVYHYLNLSLQTSGDLDKDNRESKKQGLLVNCAGSINTSKRHKSENISGRADYYLIYVTAGNLLFSNGKSALRLFAGDVIILPPHTAYMQQLDNDGGLNYLWLHFTGGGVDEALREYGIKLYPFINKTSPSNHLQTRFQRLFDCFIKNDKFRERDLSASLEKLLIELARAIVNEEKPRVSLSKSINYINNHYNTQIKIPDLAKMDGHSMTRYNLHFKEQMGMPPTKYIIKLRMNMAIELLESSDLSIYQIGEMCGYEDYNFFAKVFKQHTGLSPKKYKEQLIK